MHFMDKHKIQKALLGHIIEGISVVIITPLKSAYVSLCAKLEAYEECLIGFYPNSYFRLENEMRGMIVLTPQGISSQDIIYAFSDIDVLFYGLGGSLIETITIGSIVEVSSAVSTNGVTSPLVETGKFKSVVCGYSPCLLGDEAARYCNEAVLAGCHVVDMEVVACASAAIKNSVRFTSWLVVSDIPGKINFYDLNDNLKSNLSQSRSLIISEIEAYIDTLKYKNSRI